MPFVEVALADVEIEKPQALPLGDYTWQVQPGAEYRESKYAKDNTGQPLQELNVRFDIADGDFAGRVMFVHYPDPTAISEKGKSLKWSAQALKKLEIALGTDALPGEDPARYLNRVATSGSNRFGASIVPGRYIKQGATEAEPEFGIFSVHPAA